MNYKTEAQPWAPQSTHNAQMVLPTRPNYPMFAKWWPANWVWQTFEVIKTVKGVGKIKRKQQPLVCLYPMLSLKQYAPA